MGRYRDAALFLLLAAVWGTAFVATDVGLEYLPPTLLAAFRFDLAAVALFAVVFATGRQWRPKTRDDWTYVIGGGIFCIGAHHALLFAGQQYVTGAVASILLGLVPVITPAMTRLLADGERLSPLGAVGVLLGFVGVVVIANPNPTHLLTSARGVVLVLASAVAFTVGAVYTHRTEPTLSVVSGQSWMMGVGAVALHLTSFALPNVSMADVHVTPTAVEAIVYLALVAGAGGFSLYFLLLDRLGPIEISLVEYVIPLFAALFGWLVLKQTVTPTTVGGFAFIFAGFVLIKRHAIQSELGSVFGRRESRVEE